MGESRPRGRYAGIRGQPIQINGSSVWYNAHTADFTAIEGLSEAMAQRLDPEKIIVSGSHVRGTVGEESDVDLLVVLDFECSAVEKVVEIWSATRPGVAVDFVLAKPSDFQHRYRQHEPIVREAVDRGRILHERSLDLIANQNGFARAK